MKARLFTGSQWEAIRAVAEMKRPYGETIRRCMRRAEIDDGVRLG
jgi:hypothetical protein